MLLKYTLLLILLCPAYSEVNMVFKGVKSTYITRGEVDYSVASSKLVKKLDANSTFMLLLNSKSYLLNNNFYKDGNFVYKDLKLHFKKAYKFSGKFFMYRVKGSYRGSNINAQEAIFYNGALKLKECEIVTPKRVIRRKIYIIKHL